MVQPSTADIERRAREVLARLDPSAADVMRVQGRHVSDRLASDALGKRDHVESSQAISAAMPRRPHWQPRQVVPLSEQRRQEIATAGRPRDVDYPGRGRELADAANESWRHYFSERYGLALDDDLHRDAWLEQQAVEPREDHYAGSPDFDDFDMPGQRAAADEHVQEQVQT
ncbi:hypothetical protein EV383_4330 [Pseudonocardia sediminis]|uniref:Uncharacterized protein n=2 Tax=Pseudonocardia sediminis TaxID=1397368 RepID=A0A4Q7UZ36_PSEST|nr:hypothetical protein EV383_4330 [Pseudonocardia sediminis]